MTNKRMIICIVSMVLLLIIAKCGYTIANLTVAEKEIMKITANDGRKFKVVYLLHNFPDESYEIVVYGKSGDNTSIFHGDGKGTSDIEIIHLFKENDVDYYKAIKKHWEGDKEKIFVCSDSKKINIMTDGSYIESYALDILVDIDQSENSAELFIPIAKHEILTSNQADYIMAYAEKLILSGEDDIIRKIKYFVDNPEDMVCEVYTQEEILTKCRELLSEYGDGENRRSYE